MAAIFKEKLNETVLLETDTNQVTASIWGDLIEYGGKLRAFSSNWETKRAPCSFAASVGRAKGMERPLWKAAFRLKNRPVSTFSFTCAADSLV